MKITRSTLVLSIVLLLTVSVFGYYTWFSPNQSPPAGNRIKSSKVENNSLDHNSRAETFDRLSAKARQAKQFAAANQFNNTICFLLDMRLHSGKNRFFVYNMNSDSVEMEGLVTHGSGSDNGTENLTFSNTPNSHCTSLGKYRIGKSYNGIFGLAYKLVGLEKTNNKAFDRFIVLHGHDCVPDSEVFPYSICHSLGCPTVSPAFLTRLQTIIDNADKSILLWIYY